MTEEQVPLEFEKYQYGALAAHLASSKDPETARLAGGTLELLAGKDGLNLGDDAVGFIEGTQASDKGVQRAINIYAGHFHEKMSKYKPAQLSSWYAPALKGLDEDTRGILLGELSNHQETVGQIENKVHEAQYVLGDEAPEGFHSQEEIDRAQKTQLKYNGVLLVMHTLQRYVFENLRSESVNANRLKELKDLAGKLVPN